MTSSSSSSVENSSIPCLVARTQITNSTVHSGTRKLSKSEALTQVNIRLTVLLDATSCNLYRCMNIPEDNFDMGSTQLCLAT